VTEPQDKYEESKNRERVAGIIDYETGEVNLTWTKTDDATTALGDLVRNDG